MDNRRNSGSWGRPDPEYHGYDQQPPQAFPVRSSTRPAGRNNPLHHQQQPYADVPRSRQQSLQVDTQNAYPARKNAPTASPLSPNDQSRHGSRHGSVSDRSPLQRLEGKLGDISKEEKRARIEEAEHRARQTSAAANQSRRVHPDHHPLPSSSEMNSNHFRHERRQSSAPGPGPPNDYPRERQSLDHEIAPQGQNKQAVGASQKFRRASDALRMQNHQQSGDGPSQIPHEQPPPTSRSSNDRDQLERSSSKNYRHRARDAGYAGAAAAAYSAPLGDFGSNGADGREHRRRSSAYKVSPEESLSREDGRQIRSISNAQEHPPSSRGTERVPGSNQQIQSDHVGAGERLRDATKNKQPDPIPPSAVKTGNSHGPAYSIPPQTAAGQAARDNLGFAHVQSIPAPNDAQAQRDRHHHGFNDFFHRSHKRDRVYQKAPELEDWRQAGVARLTLDDLAFEHAGNANTHPWERPGSGRRGGSGLNAPGKYDGPYDEEAKSFSPPLYLKCGPLLRYTGMRRERLSQPSRSGVTEREFWRGSVMIVTVDEHSSYDGIPSLRLFVQPMDLIPPLPADYEGSDEQLSPEYIDPVAGQIKVSRIGQPLYVRPVDLLEDGVDVSRVENESGLFALTRSSTHAPQRIDGSDEQRRQNIVPGSQSRVKNRDGEKAGKYREVRAARLHAERGVSFWRFNIEIELGSHQARVAYRINQGPAIGFWVPGRNQTMNMMFHSCNGFSLSVDSNLFSGPDPLWRDVMNKHQSRPFHVMLGGGDQIYNDAAMRDTILFKEWLQTKNPEHKYRAEFTMDMQDELESFYLNRYSMWFSQGLFGMANSQIPMVNIWDDHDIIDGYGSYPHHFMSTKIFTGLGAVAFKYYMLFQHQSLVSETHREEPSWLLGASPGPYINELSRSLFMFLGRKVAFLGLDCRTERMRDEVLSQQSYDIIFNRCRKEIVKGETKHLIVLLGVPIAYPRLNFLENILTSRVMDPIKALGRTGLLGGFVNKFDGGVEILDDLDDHWTAKHHKAERNWFIQELQELAAEKSVRITILGGDVHLGAVGQFYTKKKLGVAKDRDHRYMPNVVSSAIVNTPPPVIMADVLNKRNKIHHLDDETDEDMIPMFEQDVNGKPRNNNHLLPRRNFCTITEYIPGSTPPPSPGPQHEPLYPQNGDRRNPPGSMQRSMSASRGSRPGSLVRRLSGSSGPQRSTSWLREGDHRHEPRRPKTGVEGNEESYFPTAAARPTNAFHRRPTDLSEKAALKATAKGGADANVEGRDTGHIDLQGGLDVCLNMEIDQRDPVGATAPYRLLIPALWYGGSPDVNTARFKSKGAAFMDRLKGRSDHRRPSFDDRSHGSTGSHSSSENDEWPSGRLDGTALDSRHQGAHRPLSQPTRANRPHGYDGTSDGGVYNKETGPPPPRGRHPALYDADINNDRDPRVLRPETEASSSQASGPGDTAREKRSWNIFGRRHQHDRNRVYDQEPHDDYPETEGSYTGSDISDEYRQRSQSRKPGVAERFFGTKGSGSRQQESTAGSHRPSTSGQQQQDASQKTGWKIWR